MLNILLPGKATLKIENAQHIAPRTGHTKEVDAQYIALLPGQATLKKEDAQHIAPRTSHT